MPKKLNFLGGMQNYDPKTGEYEPDLKGANGERPTGFNKGKSQHDKINEKRMGKNALGYGEEETEEDKSFDTTNEKRINGKENLKNKIEEWKKNNPDGKVEENVDIESLKEKQEPDGDAEFQQEINETADKIRSSGDRYTYMMLDRLRSDAEYVLQEGKGATNQLWYNGNPKKHIALMKELHRGLKDKPEWLSMDKINEYEQKFNEFGDVYSKDEDRSKLTKAGFNIDDTYSGGDTYEIFDKDTKQYNSISLSDNGKYYYAVINKQVYYYKDLDTAIDRALYKSGKAPDKGAIGWENGAYDRERAEKELKELRGD